MKHSSFATFGVILVLGATSLTAVEGDNTAVNVRDTSAHEVTADHQKMNKSDTRITQLIRRAVVKDKSLSTYAHNVKVITANGQVTLKGPVETTAEKDKIFSKAVRIAGARNITNQLEVTKSE